MAKSFSLIVTAPDSEPVHYRLTRERVTLGRAEENQIAVSVKAISAGHCEFQKTETGSYRLIDLKSTNGTRVNGQRLMDPCGVILKNGDRVLFGETVEALFFEAIDAEATGRKRPVFESGAFVDQSPVSVWVDASAEAWGEEEINPVAAAVARQQEAAMAPGSGGR